MPNPEEDAERVWALIKDLPVAMVVTHNGRGQEMRARPMAAHPAQEESAIYFLTDADSPKASEVEGDNTICLAFADNKNQKYVSITGRADVIEDKTRIGQLYSIYDRAFWPDENDPRIRILQVVPETAEFWEGAGRVVTALKLIAASVSGERTQIGKNEKVGFNR